MDDNFLIRLGASGEPIGRTNYIPAPTMQASDPYPSIHFSNFQSDEFIDQAPQIG